MLNTAIKARLAVQVGRLYIYKRRRPKRGVEHVTRRARHRRVSTLLHALRRVPPCAAARAALKPFSDRAGPPITFS